MTMNIPAASQKISWKLNIAFAAVFVLGIIVGATVVGLLVKQRMQNFAQHGVQSLKPRIVERLTRELDPKPAQQEELEGIVNDASNELEDLRRRNAPLVKEIVNRHSHRLENSLNETQRGKFSALKSKLKQEWYRQKGNSLRIERAEPKP